MILYCKALKMNGYFHMEIDKEKGEQVRKRLGIWFQ